MKLSLKIYEIEQTVLKDVTSSDNLKKENALITYIVLTFGIRIGNDLGEDNFRDKNVRGASTLCVENIILECLQNIGVIQQINKAENENAIECWVKNDKGVFMFMLFDYEWGVITCR